MKEHLELLFVLLPTGGAGLAPVTSGLLHRRRCRALLPADRRHDDSLQLHHMASLVQTLSRGTHRERDPGPEQSQTQGECCPGERIESGTQAQNKVRCKVSERIESGTQA